MPSEYLGRPVTATLHESRVATALALAPTLEQATPVGLALVHAYHVVLVV